MNLILIMRALTVIVSFKFVIIKYLKVYDLNLYERETRSLGKATVHN